MAQLQEINYKDQTGLAKAMNAGKPFYLVGEEIKLKVINEELSQTEQQLVSELEKAENCKERVDRETFWVNVEKRG